MVAPRGNKEDRRLLVQVLVFLVIALVGTAVVLTSQREDGPPVPAPPVQESAAATPDPVESWPVETVAPSGEVVAGDGTFLDPAGVDRTDPDAVAEAAATLLASHDAVLDDSEADARERARPLLDPVLLTRPEPARATVGAPWLWAQEHRAFSSPAVTAVEIPSLSHDHAGETEEEHAEHADRVGAEAENAAGEPVLAYQYDVLYHWQGRDGRVSEPDAAVVRSVLLELTEVGGEWIVTESFYGDPRELTY